MKELIFSSPAELEAFKKSIIWRDFRIELHMLRNGLRKELLSIVPSSAGQNLSTPEVLMHIGDLSGRIAMINYFLSMPDTLSNVKEAERLNEEEEDE